MATAISALPNEVSENNNVVQAKNEKIADPPKQVPVSNTTELSQESIHQIVQGLQQAGGSTILPTRDIPTNNSHITQDEAIKPNYIPKSSNDNYIEEESTMESLIQQNKNKKQEQDKLDTIYDELQTPVMVMILFFLFQLPFFNKFMTKHAPSLFSRDGNPSFSGYFVKTLIFGITFYGITKITNELSRV